MKKFLIAGVLLAGLWLCGAAAAHSYQQGNISIGHCWARATAPGMTAGAVYLPLLNKGKDEDRLISATSALAAQVRIHQTVNENGVMAMKPLDSVALKPGEPVALRPGGMHLMLIGLKRPLKEGEMFPLTLQFEKAGPVTIEVMVDAIGATQPGH